MPPTRQDETPEYPFYGPFGGIQSEVPPSRIGNDGFAEVQNLLLRHSVARIIPAFTPITSNSLDSPCMGIFDFYDQKGTRHSGAFTQSGMYAYGQNAAPGTWVNIPAGTAGSANWAPGQGFSLSAFPYEFIQTAVVGYKLFFSNITLPVQMWDGGVLGFSGYFTADNYPPPSPPGYTPGHIHPTQARYLMELGFHLVVGNLWAASETDYPAPSQVRWSAVGDGMDWSSFSAGINDLFNNLGPIMGMTRLFQTGYIFQKLGVTQMIPTGNALAPFDFIPMGAGARGNNFPYSLASFSEQIACYAARDDIFVFDGTQSQPIGQRPIDGNRRLGARTRILADLFSVSGYSDESAIPTGGEGGNNRARVYGVISSSSNGTAIGAYWLFIPELNKAWIYNFDEGNWTQTYFNNGQLNGPALGSFLAQQTTASTNWPNGFIPVDSLTIADNIGPGLAYLDFSKPGLPPTVGSINSTDGWYVRSGNLDFDDNRHPHNVNKLRIVLTDVAAGMQFYIRLYNEVGYVTPTRLVTLGDGTGNAITIMVYLDNGITGKYITWELSGPPGVPFELVEITPYPIIGGEVMTRCEVAVLPTPPPPIVTVSITPGTATLQPGGTQQFHATVTGASNQSVTWTASQGTITSGGLYTAPSVTTATSATVTATSVADPTVSLSVVVTIVVTTTVTVIPGSFTLTAGEQVQMTATVTGNTNHNVTWSATLGTINAAGLYTAPNVTTTSVTTITATSVADPTVSGTSQMSITAPTNVVVVVSPPGITLNPGQTQQYTEVVNGITDQNVTWSLQTGTPGVAALGTLSSTGLYTAPASVSVQSYETIIATSVGYPAANGVANITLNAGGVPGQLDLLQWMVLSTRSSNHLVGDPSAPYSVQMLDTDPGYPSNYPRGVCWQMKNKLGNPWDAHSYDQNWITHWITENGDSVDQAACQAANGTTCWMYARAYKRYITPVKIMPRFYTPNTPGGVIHDNPTPNDVIRTTNCETTTSTVHIGAVRGITSGPFKISWGGSIDHGSGTLANGPNYDSVNGVNTIRVQYQYSGNPTSGFADNEEYYYVLGFGEVAWYYYHNGTFVQKTVNTTLAAGGAPVPNFPCGVGKSWFV